METLKRCTQCASEIPLEARKCPKCLSRQPGATRLYRDMDRKMIGGVCAGLARELGLDVTLVRVVVALLALMSVGVVFWGYVVLWAITPASPLGEAPLARAAEKTRTFFSHQKPQGAPQPSPREPAA